MKNFIFHAPTKVVAYVGIENQTVPICFANIYVGDDFMSARMQRWVTN